MPNHASMLSSLVATCCLIWFVVVWLVCATGFTQLFRYYWTRPKPAACLTSLQDDQVPFVTVIRPVKGLDPRLYECLAASLRQTYPSNKIRTVFCVAQRSDPAFPILERLCRDFDGVQVQILVEEEDPMLLQDRNALGPNPKIRNMSRAYREAEGEIVWILDCNVWVGKGVCGRLVDLLCGFGEGDKGKSSRTKYKFVHQTPIVVDMDSQSMTRQERKELLGERWSSQPDSFARTSSSSSSSLSKLKLLLQRGGGRLDEAFLSSSHAKFYLAINTVAVAPCIIGKSSMFRRSHLKQITSSDPTRLPGIDFFSHNICEDHLIGDALWKTPQPFELEPAKARASASREKWGRHAMLFGDLCFQPVSHTSLAAYLDRRIRWLRVRKFTVTLATLVEPGTECFVCGAYGAYAFVTLSCLAGPASRLFFFTLFWLCNAVAWCALDYSQYLLLHSAKTVEMDANTPDFVLPPSSSSSSSSPSLAASASPSSTSPSTSTVLQPLLSSTEDDRSLLPQPRLLDGARRSFGHFLIAWLGREALALPVWIVAFWGGVTVEWRGKRFWVGLDMKVHEMGGEKGALKDGGGGGGG